MKKIFFMFLLIVFVFSLTSCSNNTLGVLTPEKVKTYFVNNSEYEFFDDEAIMKMLGIKGYKKDEKGESVFYTVMNKNNKEFLFVLTTTNDAQLTKFVDKTKIIKDNKTNIEIASVIKEGKYHYYYKHGDYIVMAEIDESNKESLIKILKDLNIYIKE